MQAMSIGTSEDCRHLEQLHDAERQLIDALAAARECIARCEQALHTLAEIRLRIAAEQQANPLTAQHLAHVTLAQNGHDNGCRASQRAASLTAREVEVLQLIAAGHSNRQIAESLFLSPRTIERHIANIYLKIDVHSKAEATSYARQRGRA
ncbi:MAG: LuxR C-terminal-related transcriptional regulator [Chloroflexota bacterium]|nr:LuxR C-terminal-related transcriptional regulator [Chloroflexota bacterium]